MCRTYLVSAGTEMGGISWSRTILTGVLFLVIVIFTGLLYKFPGAMFQCCPSPRSMGSLTTLPSARWKVSQQRLDVILPGRHVAQAAQWITPCLLVDEDGLLRLQSVDVNAEDHLGSRRVVDLHPGLFGGVRGEQKQHPPIERLVTPLFGKRDGKLRRTAGFCEDSDWTQQDNDQDSQANSVETGLPSGRKVPKWLVHTDSLLSRDR